MTPRTPYLRLRAQIERALPCDGSYPTPLPLNPSPRQIAAAWAADAETLNGAYQRSEARRRAALLNWHRDRVRELEGSSA